MVINVLENYEDDTIFPKNGPRHGIWHIFNGKCCNMLIYYMYDPISLHGWCELEHFHELFIVTRSVAIS